MQWSGRPAGGSAHDGGCRNTWYPLCGWRVRERREQPSKRAKAKSLHGVSERERRARELKASEAPVFLSQSGRRSETVFRVSDDLNNCT